jgi:predicted nucleotidyltransferase
MYIYAFGSVCRGEIDKNSDIDLLAIVDNSINRFDPEIYSIYTLSRLKEIWEQGNPFAWHLALESKVIFSYNKIDILKELGMPKKYIEGIKDCKKFYNIFNVSVASISSSHSSVVFDLSTVFLTIRNFATCFSLAMLKRPYFSRNSAKLLGKYSIPISNTSYNIYEKSRILCTRGLGKDINKKQILFALKEIEIIDKWMSDLIKLMVETNDRIQ